MKMFDIAVVGGAGHIGLPLSVFLQNKGNNVLVIDPNTEYVSLAEKGSPPFVEKSFKPNLKKSLLNGLKFTNNIEKIKSKDYIIVTIGSSSDKKDIKLFDNLMNEVINLSKNNTKIILRSTLSLETFKSLKKNKQIKSKNLKIAYCPERIAEGLAFEELEKIPQIIGADDKDSYIFSKFFEMNGFETLETDIDTAIFIKLFSNAYRYASFTLINEFDNIATSNNVDFDLVLQLATHKYDRLNSIPLPGFVGGPCLIKDTKTFVESYEKDNILLKNLSKTNKEYLENTIRQCEKQFSGKEIIQLGLTFKPHSDDLRSSISLELRKELINNGYDVYSVDPFLNQSQVNFKLFSYEEVKNKTKNVLISTNHKNFEKIDFSNKNLITVGKN